MSAGMAEGPPQVEVFRGDDPAGAVDRSDDPPSAIPLVDLSWVDPKVVEISSNYRIVASVTKFLAKHPILKVDEYSSYFSVLPCGATESVSLGRSGTNPPFFYMYACFFTDLHVSLPFDEFTMGVLQALNVAPTQVHPNTWASLQAFHLLCDVIHLHPTPSCFLSYYTSHPAKKAAWHSLVSRSEGALFDSFALSYKSFKERFVKVIIRPEATTYFFDSVGRGFLCIGLDSLVISRCGRG